MAADAIASAIGAVANTVSSFVNKAAQEYGLQKGMEVGTVQFEQSKTLNAYGAVSANRKSEMILITLAIAAIVFVVIIQKRS